MKQKQIGQIIPFLHDGYLLISLNKKWIDVFGKIPTFSVCINDGKLNLCTVEQISRSIKNE